MPRQAVATYLETSVASAATTDIGSINTLRVVITGTATITSLGSTPNNHKYVRMASTATLTHNATSLILPGGANIVAAAGDTFEAFSDGSGNWRIYGYERASGRQIDYAEGNWTPAFTFSTPPTGLTGTFTGSYTKSGRLVHVKLSCILTNKGSGGAGALTITGFPFANAGIVAQLPPVVQSIGLTAGYTYLTLQLAGSTATVYQMGDNNVPATVPWSALVNTSYIVASGSYNT